MYFTCIGPMLVAKTLFLTDCYCKNCLNLEQNVIPFNPDVCNAGIVNYSLCKWDFYCE